MDSPAIKAIKLQNAMQLFSLLVHQSPKKARVQANETGEDSARAIATFHLPQNVSFTEYMDFVKSLDSYVKAVYGFDSVKFMEQPTFSHDTMNGDVPVVNIVFTITFA